MFTEHPCLVNTLHHLDKYILQLEQILVMILTSDQVKEWITLHQPDTGKIFQMKGFVGCIITNIISNDNSHPSVSS